MANLVRGKHRSVVELMLKGFAFLQKYDQRVTAGKHTNDNVETFPTESTDLNTARTQIHEHLKNLYAAKK